MCGALACAAVYNYGYVSPATVFSLMRATDNFSNAVDVYNSATGTWSTAQLSVARYYLAAASVGNVALFAGGVTGGALLCRENVDEGLSIVLYVERFRMLHCCGSASPETACFLMRPTSAAFAFSTVDLYNSATGAWSTAQLSVARWALAAASVGNVALFAGGATSSTLLRMLWGGDVYGCACVERLRVLPCIIMVMFPLRPCFLSCAQLQMVLLMLPMCTTVKRGHGRRLSSVWRAGFLQLHRSGTWFCSLGVKYQVRCFSGR